MRVQEVPKADVWSTHRHRKVDGRQSESTFVIMLSVDIHSILQMPHCCHRYKWHLFQLILKISSFPLPLVVVLEQEPQQTPLSPRVQGAAIGHRTDSQTERDRCP